MLSLTPHPQIRPDSQRFSMYLTTLKGEFQLMALKIDSLRKERRVQSERQVIITKIPYLLRRLFSQSTPGASRMQQVSCNTTIPSSERKVYHNPPLHPIRSTNQRFNLSSPTKSTTSSATAKTQAYKRTSWTVLRPPWITPVSCS